MARTYRTPEDKRRKYWQREAKPARKQTNKQNRRKNKLLTKDIDSELYPLYKGTSGWLTH